MNNTSLHHTKCSTSVRLLTFVLAAFSEQYALDGRGYRLSHMTAIGRHQLLKLEVVPFPILSWVHCSLDFIAPENISSCRSRHGFLSVDFYSHFAWEHLLRRFCSRARSGISLPHIYLQVINTATVSRREIDVSQSTDCLFSRSFRLRRAKIQVS